MLTKKLTSFLQRTTLPRINYSNNTAPDITPKNILSCLFCGQHFLNENLLSLHLTRRHLNPVSDHLRQNPVNTYKSILGDNHILTDAEMRYPDGLVIALQGDDRGKWFSAKKNLSGDPIKAIQNEHGFSFRQAMEFAAGLTGLTSEQLKLLQSESMYGLTVEHESSLVGSPEELKKRQQNVETSRNIWSITEDLKGSLAEVYLVKHRGISAETIDRLAFRYLPGKLKYQDLRKGEIVSQPALIVPIENFAGELTGVQRVFLDENTGDKDTAKGFSKCNKGLLKGSAAIVQRGLKNGIVYIVEGAETGASVASVVGSEATVLASLGVSLLQDLGRNALAFSPKEVVLAVDNDVSVDAQKCTRKAFKRLRTEVGTRVRMTVPQMLSRLEGGEKSVDWNDVLKVLGPDELREQLKVAYK